MKGWAGPVPTASGDIMKVIYLSTYRKKRHRDEGVAPPRPPDAPPKHEISISLQDDGTHHVLLRGAYAQSEDLAEEAMAESILYLIWRRRSADRPEK